MAAWVDPFHFLGSPCRGKPMESHRIKSLIHSLLTKDSPILVAEEYSGSTPLHLGLEFLQACDETISGPGQECGMIFIFTPTDEAYESHEKSDDSDMGWANDVEEEDEHRYEEQMGTTLGPKRRLQTQLCLDDWLLKHGARGNTAKLLSRIQIIRIKDLVQLAVCLSTFPSTHLRLPKTSQDEGMRYKVLIMLHDMSILPLSLLSLPKMATAPAPPSSPARSASDPLQEDIQEQRISAYVAIAGHALAVVDFVPERLLMLDLGLDAPSLKILRCYFDDDIEMDYADAAV